MRHQRKVARINKFIIMAMMMKKEIILWLWEIILGIGMRLESFSERVVLELPWLVLIIRKKGKLLLRLLRIKKSIIIKLVLSSKFYNIWESMILRILWMLFILKTMLCLENICACLSKNLVWIYSNFWKLMILMALIII